MAESLARRRAVATRVLLSYAIIMTAFALAAGWSVWALRNAANETALMRSGYFPLALTVRDLSAKQDTWNAQLNHITAARNPADIRVWFDFATRIGRPSLFREVRAAITRAFMAPGDVAVRRVASELLQETADIEHILDADNDLLNRLFEALDHRDALAEQLRDELVTRGSQAGKRMKSLEARVEWHVDRLSDKARARERLAIELLVALSVMTLAVGVARGP